MYESETGLILVLPGQTDGGKRRLCKFIKFFSPLLDPSFFIETRHFSSSSDLTCCCLCLEGFICEDRLCVQLVSQQGCAISAGHITHSWDARAVRRGHSSPSHTHHTQCSVLSNTPLHHAVQDTQCNLVRKHTVVSGITRLCR